MAKYRTTLVQDESAVPGGYVRLNSFGHQTLEYRLLKKARWHGIIRACKLQRFADAKRGTIWVHEADASAFLASRQRKRANHGQATIASPVAASRSTTMPLPFPEPQPAPPADGTLIALADAAARIERQLAGVAASLDALTRVACRMVGAAGQVEPSTFEG
jgi:hypothetical protein